jgi:hypothetical protein
MLYDRNVPACSFTANGIRTYVIPFGQITDRNMKDRPVIEHISGGIKDIYAKMV